MAWARGLALPRAAGFRPRPASEGQRRRVPGRRSKRQAVRQAASRAARVAPGDQTDRCRPLRRDGRATRGCNGRAACGGHGEAGSRRRCRNCLGAAAGGGRPWEASGCARGPAYAGVSRSWTRAVPWGAAVCERCRLFIRCGPAVWPRSRWPRRISARIADRRRPPVPGIAARCRSWPPGPSRARGSWWIAIGEECADPGSARRNARPAGDHGRTTCRVQLPTHIPRMILYGSGLPKGTAKGRDSRLREARGLGGDRRLRKTCMEVVGVWDAVGAVGMRFEEMKVIDLRVAPPARPELVLLVNDVVYGDKAGVVVVRGASQRGCCRPIENARGVLGVGWSE